MRCCVCRRFDRCFSPRCERRGRAETEKPRRCGNTVRGRYKAKTKFGKEITLQFQSIRTFVLLAGVALLSITAIAREAKPKPRDCTFVSATQVGEHCWSRLDSCGNVTLIGNECVYTEDKPSKQRRSSISPKPQVNQRQIGTTAKSE